MNQLMWLSVVFAAFGLGVWFGWEQWGRAYQRLRSAQTRRLNEIVQEALSVVQLPTGQRVSVKDARHTIADSLQYWLDRNAGNYPPADRFNDETHVIPPAWPSRGVLKNWIAILRA